MQAVRVRDQTRKLKKKARQAVESASRGNQNMFLAGQYLRDERPQGAAGADFDKQPRAVRVHPSDLLYELHRFEQASENLALEVLGFALKTIPRAVQGERAGLLQCETADEGGQ